MNVLEEIQNCPVEWKELGDKNVAKLSRGKVMSKQFLEENKGEFPVYSSQTANNGEIGRISSFEYDGEYITWTTDGANAGTVFYRRGKFSITNVCGLVEINNDQLLTKFVYYYLTISTKKYVSSGMGNPKLMSNVMGKIKIPIPPLEIQKKIVQKLDKMTEFVTELTSELTSRKKQYSFYRDKLLSFEDKVYQVEWKKLSEYLKKGKGTKITASQMKLLHKEGAPIRIFAGGKTYADVNYGDIPDKDIHTEEAIVVKSRGIIDFEYCTEPFSFKNEFWSYSSDNENINLRYIYHYLVHNKEHFQNIANNMQMPQISSNDTENFKIPVPSLEIQSRIVKVLDNFDTVCNDLNIGLPKEIELRQKQYEYFREKLLTFVAEGEYTESRVEEWDNSAILNLLQWVFGPIKVELGVICNFVRGNGLQKKDFTEIGKSVIHYGQIYTKYDFTAVETLSKTSELVFEKLKKAYPNDLVMATTSENVEDVGKAIVWEGKEEIGISGDSYIIRTNQNSRYLNYWFRSTSFQSQKERKVTGTKVIRINSKDMEKFKIVLPSLTEQKRIVSILDNFNTLINSLSGGLPKEIKLRQKQYEYWREQLLYYNE